MIRSKFFNIKEVGWITTNFPFNTTTILSSIGNISSQSTLPRTIPLAFPFGSQGFIKFCWWLSNCEARFLFQYQSHVAIVHRPFKSPVVVMQSTLSDETFSLPLQSCWRFPRVFSFFLFFLFAFPLALGLRKCNFPERGASRKTLECPLLGWECCVRSQLWSWKVRGWERVAVWWNFSNECCSETPTEFDCFENNHNH